MTSRSKFWLAFAAVGFGTMTCSAVMAFLADHHWLVTYQLAERFEETCWWVQLGGVVLSVVGGIGMLKSLSDTLALRIGAALILAGLLVVLLSGGPSAIFNVHDWKIALVLPPLVTLADGTILVFVSLSR